VIRVRTLAVLVFAGSLIASPVTGSVAVSGITVPSQQPADTADVLGLDVTVPGTITAGQTVEVSGEVTFFERPLRDVEREITTKVFVDGREVASQSITVRDGGTRRVDLSVTLDEAGEKDVVVRSIISWQGLEYTVERSRTVDVSPLDIIEGPRLGVTTGGDRTVGEPTTITASTTAPTIQAVNRSVRVTVRLLVDGTEVANANRSLSDGSNGTVSFNWTPVELGKTNLTVIATASVGDQSVSVQRSRSVDVSPAARQTSLRGAAFTTPPGLTDEVARLRNATDLVDLPHAFVLANADTAALVFTNTEPASGMATITGIRVNRSRSIQVGEVNLSVVAATNASFTVDGTDVPLDSLARDPQSRNLELVEASGFHTEVSVLADRDYPGSLTVPVTAGRLSVDRPSARLSGEPTERARDVLASTTRINRGSTDSAHVPSRIANVNNTAGIPTVQIKERYWGGANATVHGVVLAPNTTAYRYLQAVNPTNVSATRGGEVLYVTNRTVSPTVYPNVSAVTDQADRNHGRTVAVEANLSGARISVQESIEHYTGKECGDELTVVYVSGGPVCVNVPVDAAADAGVAWSAVPTSRSHLLPVVGVSSTHQDRPLGRLGGQYRIVGTVVSASAYGLSGPASETVVLVVSDLTRTGGLDRERMSPSERAIVENRSGTFTDRLRESATTTEYLGRRGLPVNEPIGDRSPAPPSDPDGDGQYEDVTGDGRVEYEDVVTMFENVGGERVQTNEDVFDFNGNGRVDFADIVRLFTQVNR
jgi:hypothetical protein